MKYKSSISTSNIVKAKSILEEEITNCGFVKYKIENCNIVPYRIYNDDTGYLIESYLFSFEVEVMGFDA